LNGRNVPTNAESGQEVGKLLIRFIMKKNNLKKTLAAMAVLGLVNQDTSAANLPTSYAGLNLAENSVLNKPALSQESAVTEYSRISQLSASQRQAIAARMRSDFSGYMNETFYLSNNQITCLTSYWNTTQDIEFINFLAARVEAGDRLTWIVDFTLVNEPPVLMGKPKNRKGEGGWTEKDGWYIKFSIEF